MGSPIAVFCLVMELLLLPIQAQILKGVGLVGSATNKEALLNTDSNICISAEKPMYPISCILSPFLLLSD